MIPSLIKSDINVYKLCLTALHRPDRLRLAFDLRGGDGRREGEQEEADEEEGETAVEEEEGRDSGSLHPNAALSLSLFLPQFLSLRLIAAHTDTSLGYVETFNGS